jgi:toxin ParE1/3/4
VAHKISFSPEALSDLRELYLFIADRAGDIRAMAYVDRIESYCRGFANSPERRTRRDDLLPGLRIVGFERRASIAFHTTADAVIIDRILYGGRDLEVLGDDG